MAKVCFPWFDTRFFTDAGDPLVAGIVEVYNAGTDIEATTYNEAGSANTWPIVLSDTGTCQLRGTAGSSYDIVIKTSGGALVRTIESVTLGGDGDVYDGSYLRLDCSNSPLTGPLVIAPTTGNLNPLIIRAKDGTYAVRVEDGTGATPTSAATSILATTNYTALYMGNGASGGNETRFTAYCNPNGNASSGLFGGNASVFSNVENAEYANSSVRFASRTLSRFVSDVAAYDSISWGSAPTFTWDSTEVGARTYATREWVGSPTGFLPLSAGSEKALTGDLYGQDSPYGDGYRLERSGAYPALKLWCNEYAMYLQVNDLGQVVVQSGNSITLQASSHVIIDAAFLQARTIRPESSSGLLLESHNGTDIGLLGAGGGADAIWYGVHSFGALVVLNAGVNIFSGATSYRGGASSVSYASRVVGDTHDRFQVLAGSDVMFGSGSSAPDTNVKRVAENVLGTDDSFSIALYQYFGVPSTDGSWRTFVSGADLVTEKRISGSWVEQSRITGS